MGIVYQTSMKSYMLFNVRDKLPMASYYIHYKTLDKLNISKIDI